MIEKPIIPDFSFIKFLQSVIKGKSGDFSPWSSRGFFIPTSSVTSALYLALNDLTQTGILKTKNDNLLLSSQVDYRISYVCQPFAFPTVEPTKQNRVVLVSHQFGFPQKLDIIQRFAAENGSILIEDCSHSIDGVINYRPKVEMTKYAIFSFSNFFPSLVGGGLWVDDAEKADRILDYMTKNHQGFFSFLAIISAFIINKSAKNKLKSVYSLNAISKTYPKLNFLFKRSISYFLSNEIIERRLENWRLLREMILGTGLIDDLEENIIPWAVPIRIKNDKVLGELEGFYGVGSKIITSYFDTNKNLLNPNLEKRAIFPIHQQISKIDIEKVAERIIKIVC